ncbi:hypothetical protein B0T14DRAFT_434802 [Immersiella caudata]|uniref:Uncharacterized protein n=1 Tax=Immersiella caudata TaxID=314043 RepID=A0AA39WJJ1_9PEZI|nr:hypothetical protein B0T14DRAFT_434802 [Immersiella caudata]
MFDDSFERSGVYFTVLETLRVSSDWARDTLKTWEALLEQWKHDAQPEKLFSPADLVALEENWAVVDRHIRARFEELMTRLTNKTEEIKSLRDGASGNVFNATSLREASKGIELNRAVYIFTVVTVLYTPLGFLATFFALPSLNNPGDNGLVGVPKGFKTTMIVIPLLTYLVSLAFVWYFRHIRRVKRAIRELAVMTVWTWETLKNHFSPTMDGRRQLSGFNG